MHAEQPGVDVTSDFEVYAAIGRFVFWFSKLEGMLKADLAGLLDLEVNHMDPVVSAFDFAQLVSVLKAIKLKGCDEEAKPRIERFFKECMKMNDHRVRVVHGDWTLNGVRVVSRGSREPAIHFANPDELVKLSERCEKLAVGYYPPITFTFTVR